MAVDEKADEKPKPAPDKYRNVPYFRKVKALTTLLRAESYLREHIMLGSHLGMFTEGAIAESKAKKALAKASAYLNGKEDDEIKQWIDVESNAVKPAATAEYALATTDEAKPKPE